MGWRPEDLGKNNKGVQPRKREGRIQFSTRNSKVGKVRQQMFRVWPVKLKLGENIEFVAQYMVKMNLDLSEILEECVSFCRNSENFSIIKDQTLERAKLLNITELKRKEKIELKAKALVKEAHERLNEISGTAHRSRQLYLDLAREEEDESDSDEDEL